MQRLTQASLVADVRRSGQRHRVAVTLAVAVASAVVAACSGSSTQQATSKHAATKSSRTKATAAQIVDDKGFSKLDNGHQDESAVPAQPLDAKTRALLQQELTIARQAAMKYPTVAAATAAGWFRAGPFAPGLGAHYFNWKTGGSGFSPVLAMATSDVLRPASLIYDGTKPDSRIVGLMYLGTGNRIPQGFAGYSDLWHYHTDVCIVMKASGIDTPFGADTTVTKAMCDGVHGILESRTPYMLHAWVVPGYASPQGVFSHLNKAITCADGTYHMVALDNLGSRSSACIDGTE